MQQVPENTKVAGFFHAQLRDFVNFLLQCGITLSIAALGSGCGSSDQQTNTSNVSARPQSHGDPVGRELKRGLLGEPRTLNPYLADDTYSLQVVRDLYEGLTSEGRDGAIGPGVAMSWTVNPAATEYTFLLRPDAKWSDGTPIVAKEFVAGLRHAVDPKTASGSADLLAIIKGASDVTAGRKDVSALSVRSIGDQTVQIELEHPAPFALELLSQPIATPLHISPKTSSAIGDGDVTDGPYILRSRVPGSFIELSRNNHYWNSRSVAIDRVRYINAESEATELREYFADQLDLTFTIPMPDLQRVSQQYSAQVQSAPILGTLYLAMSLASPPLANSRELRQALSMSVDRELISEQVMMGVSPAYSFVAQGVVGYSSPEYAWSKWPRDRRLAYAKSLFKQAGYSDSKPLRLRLYYNRNEGIQRLMVAIAASWKQNLGVESELISEEFRVFLAGRKDRSRWDVARLGWSADYNDASSFLNVFASGNTQNDPGYINPDFDKLIESARAEPNNQRRIQLLRQAEQLLLDDYPIIPVYFYRARRLVKPYLGGAEITPMNRTYTRHLFWKVTP